MRPEALKTSSLLAIALVAIPGAIAAACRAGEAAGPMEPTTVECPTTGERSCREASDCGPGLHCTGMRCFASQAGCPCTNVDDCGSRAHCTRGQCYSNEAGNPCSETAQCGPRAHCTVDTCYANASGSPCSEDSDCGPSSACVSGRCN